MRALSQRPSGEPVRKLTVKSNGRILFVDLQQVTYIEAEGNYVRIHTHEGDFLTREKISNMVDYLIGSDLIRIHRSTIVNRNHIKELRPWPTGEYVVLMNDGKELTLSRGFKEALVDLLTIQ